MSVYTTQQKWIPRKNWNDKNEYYLNGLYLQALGIERKSNETEEELARRISKFTKSHTITDDDLQWVGKAIQKDKYDIVHSGF